MNFLRSEWFYLASAVFCGVLPAVVLGVPIALLFARWLTGGLR